MTEQPAVTRPNSTPSTDKSCSVSLLVEERNVGGEREKGKWGRQCSGRGFLAKAGVHAESSRYTGTGVDRSQEVTSGVDGDSNGRRGGETRERRRR